MLYTLTVLGFALNLHFCGSTIASVKISSAQAQVKTNAAKCGMKMKCCKDKHVDVKVKDLHQVKEAPAKSEFFAFQLPKLPFEDFMFSAQKALLEKFFDRGPPQQPLEKVSTFLKNCNFRL